MEFQEGDEQKKLFHCFLIASLRPGETGSPLYTYQYPEDLSDNKELQQYQKFCFPFRNSDPAIGQRHQHFTFMLTDLEKRHTFGFCKLVDGGQQCYCFISALPWFEIFYKFLNCVRTIHSRNDLNTLRSLLDDLHELEIPKPKVIVNVSSSLTFCTPDSNDLPSIPESRNMMEYISAMNPKNMLEIFAALMFERRVIFAASSLSILTGCLFAAESLLFPLCWQHIFIPLLPPHILDYCHAPMPFIVGLHASLLPSVQKAAISDGVVIVNIDEKTVDTPYDDLNDMPSEAISYLRSQLGKPNIAVGNNLAGAFLKTQARLIGGYRSAIKFRMGESIVFDKDKFIELHKVGSRRNFAESLIQLQTFREFVDKRMDMLNNGIGFRDSFENEVTELQRHEGENESAMYKEWLAVTRKGGELIYNVRKHAKSNMKSAKESARQSMRDMKNAMKPVEKENHHHHPQSTLKSRQSLRESIRPMRPLRPPPPRPIPESPSQSPETKQKPKRPPPPKPERQSVRRYNLIDNDLESVDKKNMDNVCSETDAISKETTDGRPLNLLIDLSDWQAPTRTNFDFLCNDSTWKSPAQTFVESTDTDKKFNNTFENELFDFTEEEIPSVLPSHCSSSIRRAEHIKTRQQNTNDDSLFGIFDNMHNTNQSTSSMNFNWDDFPNMYRDLPPKETKNNDTTQPNQFSDGPLISFD